MNRTRTGLLGWLITSLVIMGGCTPTDDTPNAPAAAAPSKAAAASPPRAKAAAASPPSAKAAAASPPSAVDAATKTACAALDKDIKTAATKTAKAEKIGPPAGHLAVSAEYSAGAAALYAHMIGASAAVHSAADQVATALSDLSDTWAENPKTKPSKATLKTAIKTLTTACTPT